MPFKDFNNFKDFKEFEHKTSLAMGATYSAFQFQSDKKLPQLNMDRKVKKHSKELTVHTDDLSILAKRKEKNTKSTKSKFMSCDSIENFRKELEFSITSRMNSEKMT